MSRHKFCMRARTKFTQKLPSQLEDKVNVFLWYIIQMCKKHDFDLSQIGIMDETPVSFDLPSKIIWLIAKESRFCL